MDDRQNMYTKVPDPDGEQKHSDVPEGGSMIASIAVVIIVLAVVGGVFLVIQEREEQEENVMPDGEEEQEAEPEPETLSLTEGERRTIAESILERRDYYLSASTDEVHEYLQFVYQNKSEERQEKIRSLTAENIATGVSVYREMTDGLTVEDLLSGDMDWIENGTDVTIRLPGRAQVLTATRIDGEWYAF